MKDFLKYNIVVCPKLGDINAFGADPRRIAMAGHDVDNAEPIDFAGKYDSQNTAFKTRYDSLDGKFNGKTLDDYTGGTSFCCGDKSLDEIEKNEGNGSENAKIEDNLYFYHPDHLSSTSLVTTSYGEITQKHLLHPLRRNLRGRDRWQMAISLLFQC